MLTAPAALMTPTIERERRSEILSCHRECLRCSTTDLAQALYEELSPQARERLSALVGAFAAVAVVEALVEVRLQGSVRRGSGAGARSGRAGEGRAPR